MNKKFDLLVFIGRFQPFHLEHKRIIDVALTQSKYVLVLVGSSGKSRTIRNPFTFDERTNMIAGSYNESDRNRIIIKPLFDKTYNDAAWINQVQTLVRTNAIDAVNDFGFPNAGHADAKVGLIGASKDQSSYMTALMFLLSLKSTQLIFVRIFLRASIAMRLRMMFLKM